MKHLKNLVLLDILAFFTFFLLFSKLVIEFFKSQFLNVLFIYINSIWNRVCLKLSSILINSVYGDQPIK